MALLKISSSDRVLATGKTGSGKTYLMRHLAARTKRVIILDSKGRLDDWNAEDYSRDAVQRFIRGDDIRLRYRADKDTDASDLWEDAIHTAWSAERCIVYIDELYAVIPPGTRVSPGLAALWTRGREYGIGVWCCTQRPAWVPLFALSESDHFFMFRLTLDEDRKRMAAFMGAEVLKPITDKYGFYYASASSINPEYVSKLESSTAKVEEKEKGVQRVEG